MSTGPNETGERERIVVGVDGSAPSKSALAWAARHAARSGAAIEVIAAWEYPASYGWAMALPDTLDLAAETRGMLSNVVDEVLGSPPQIKPTETVVEGHPTLVLLEASERADLLVVGCRGRGAFKGMLLGTVSGYLASHAHCPVVVVHDHDHDDAHVPLQHGS